MPDRRALEIARRAKLKAHHERRLEREMRKLISAYVLAVAESPGSLAAISRRHERQIAQGLRSRLAPIAMLFGNDTLIRISRSKAAAALIEGKEVQGSFGQAIMQWLRRHAAERATSITRTIRKILAEIIADAMAEGIGERETGRRIRGRAPSISRSNAERIARTETHSAAEKGSYDAAKESGLDMVKEWASAEDNRTRPSHRDADGQIKEMDEAFEIGADALLFPGDPSGSAKEIVNCRCSTLYHPRIEGQIIR